MENPEDKPKVVKARSFTVVDDEGNQRGFFGVDDDGHPGIFLTDHQGVKRIGLGMDEEENRAALQLRNAHEQNALEAVADRQGNAFLRLFDQTGAARAEITVDSDGTTALLLRVKNNLAIMFRINSDGSYDGSIADPICFETPRLKVVK